MGVRINYARIRGLYPPTKTHPVSPSRIRIEGKDQDKEDAKSHRGDSPEDSKTLRSTSGLRPSQSVQSLVSLPNNHDLKNIKINERLK